MTTKKLKPMLSAVNAALQKTTTAEESRKVLGRAFVAAGLAPGAFAETNETYQAFLEINSMATQQAWMNKCLSQEMLNDYSIEHNALVEHLESAAIPGQKLKIQSVSGIADFYSDVEDEPMVSGQYVGFHLSMEPGESETFRICLVFNDEGVLFRQFTIGDDTVETYVKTN